MINYIEFFPDGKISNIDTKEKEIIASVDTEWYRKDEFNNINICWQRTVLNTFTGKLVSHIHYVDYENEERLDSNEVISIIFELAKVQEHQVEDYRLTLVCFACGCEFAMLRNREAVAPFLEFAYGTTITYNSIKFPYITRTGKFIRLRFMLGDVKLLLPVTHQSLAKASSLLDEEYRKKDLTVDEKSNMLALLLSDKERFEEYALNDTIATFMLFIKQQNGFNTINGTKSVRYTTVGNVTVRYFKEYVKANLPKGTFASQFSKDNHIYKQGLNLARRAYMGGINNSYFVGEMDGELILDIDFSAAYGSIMALLPYGDFGNEPEVIEHKVKDFSLGLEHEHD